jgi:hypothetical protein
MPDIFFLEFCPSTAIMRHNSIFVRTYCFEGSLVASICHNRNQNCVPTKLEMIGLAELRIINAYSLCVAHAAMPDTWKLELNKSHLNNKQTNKEKVISCVVNQ